jgi:hypothetical protein
MSVSGTITPGSLTTIIPDEPALVPAALDVPSPTMPVVAEDIQALGQALLNGVSGLSHMHKVSRATGLTNASGMTLARRINVFHCLTATTDYTFTVDTDHLETGDTPLLLVSNESSSAHNVNVVFNSSTIYTLEPGQWGLWLWLDSSDQRLMGSGTWNGNQILKWAVPQLFEYTDALGHGIDGNYYHTTCISNFATSTPATYNITGGQNGKSSVRVVNRYNTGGITISGDSGAITAINNNTWVDLCYLSGNWHVAAVGSADGS